MTDEYMCPNCVTPWKCNGPHVPEALLSTERVDEWEFTVFGNPVSLNSTYKIVYHGARCPSCGRGNARLAKAGGVEEWQTAVAWTVKAARPSGWMPARRTVIEVEWYTNRWHDGDNGLKALSDGIAVGLGCDDKGFLVQVIVNEVDKANPRALVRVRNLP